jgi:glutaredoxin
MSSTVIRGADRKKDAEKILKQPVLVLFYMDGCPHCEANRKAWEEAKKKAGVRTVEIESSATPESSGVTGFPTMTYKGKEISGQKETGDEILKELEVPVKKGGSRRRIGASRRVLNTLGGRKLRHRTLRSYISFI